MSRPLKEIIPYNESSRNSFKLNNCEGFSGPAHTNIEKKLHSEYCTCLGKEFYTSFTVHFGELVFKSIERDEEHQEDLLFLKDTTRNDGHSHIHYHQKELKKSMDQILTSKKGDFSNSLKDAATNAANVLASKFSESNYLLKSLFDTDIETAHRNDMWRLLLHQSLVFVLVLGRWILPKGKITESELSQLLLVYVAVAADILEFMTETIDDDNLKAVCSTSVHYEIWLVWTWSLLQFCLVMVASKDTELEADMDPDARRIYLKNQRKNKNISRRPFRSGKLFSRGGTKTSLATLVPSRSDWSLGTHCTTQVQDTGTGCKTKFSPERARKRNRKMPSYLLQQNTIEEDEIQESNHEHDDSQSNYEISPLSIRKNNQVNSNSRIHNKFLDSRVDYTSLAPSERRYKNKLKSASTHTTHQTPKLCRQSTFIERCPINHDTISVATTTLSPNRPARKRRTLYGLGNVLNTNISKSDRYIHTKRRDSANSSNGSNATNQQGTCLSLCPNPVQNYIKNFKMKNFLKETASCYGLLKNGEIMSIFIILVFQDGPFLFIRLYLMTEHQLLFNPDGSINQMLLFFTGKNILVILLQLYRIINLCFDRNRLKLENINDLQVNILRSTLKKSIGEDGRFKHSYMKICLYDIYGIPIHK